MYYRYFTAVSTQDGWISQDKDKPGQEKQTYKSQMYEFVDKIVIAIGVRLVAIFNLLVVCLKDQIFE